MNVNDIARTVLYSVMAIACLAVSYVIGFEDGKIKIQTEAARLTHGVWISTGPGKNTFYWLNPQKDRIQQAMEMYEANK